MTQTQPRVVAVVVAWNRQELLQQTLDGLAAQTRRADAVVVIDNASTDDSALVAREHAVVTEVLTMPRNLGGAGGFAAGIARAVVTQRADLVWIMDDDTIPTDAALEALLSARANYPGTAAVLASKAVWVDGREHPMNRPRRRPLLSRELRERAEQVGAQAIRTASFVSILIDARAIVEEGLPVADFFLWNDDFEYTARLLRRRIGLYVPASVVEHRTKVFGDSSADPGPRFVNETRNKVWTYTRSDALNPLERVLYGGRTALRWAQTLAGSDQPAELAKYGWEGLKAGLAAARPTLTVLGDTPVGEDVRTLARLRLQHLGLPIPAGLAAGGEGSSSAAGGPDPVDWSGQQGQRAPFAQPDQLDQPEPFTVLMSVYAGDNADFFTRSLVSVSRDQKLKPDHIVLVQDGPVDPELQMQIDQAPEIAGQPVKVVKLAENGGLANALANGMQHCPDSLVARADADDISLPHRFARQLPLMRDYDLVGTAIAEFTEDEMQWGLVRLHPTEHDHIVQTARFRDPFNHPSVMMRKSVVEAAGGYQECGKMEDYWLFARMISVGARCANLAEPLVAYRVGAGAYRRRGGKELWQSEVLLQNAFHQIGFTNSAQYWRNLAIRASYRWVPTPVRRLAYRGIGARWWFKNR